MYYDIITSRNINYRSYFVMYEVVEEGKHYKVLYNRNINDDINGITMPKRAK